MKTKKEFILEELQKIKGVGDFQIIAQTTKKALVKSRETKIATPENLKVISKLAAITVSLGNNYTEAVNQQRIVEGKQANFKASSTYCSPLSQINESLFSTILKKLGINLTAKASEVIYKHKDKDKFYLRVYPSLAKDYSNVSMLFDANNVMITKEDWKKIEEEYFPLKNKSEKQDLDKQVIVNNYSLENIIYLGNDNIQVINELDEETLKTLGLR